MTPMKLDPAELTGGLELLRMAIDAGDPKSELLLRVDDLLKESRASLPQSQDIRALVERLLASASAADEHAASGCNVEFVEPMKAWDYDAALYREAADALSCLAGEGWRPKVKRLVWVDNVAETAFGSYWVLTLGDLSGPYYRMQSNIMDGLKQSDRLDTIEAAKAAAQADFDRRILSALDLPAHSVEEKLP